MFSNSAIGRNDNTDAGANNTGDTNNNTNAAPPAIQYAVVNKYPHDTSYFTEGLEFYKGQLFESSGGNADESPYPSEFGISDLKTGKVTSKVKLDKTKYFGEGITLKEITEEKEKAELRRFIYNERYFPTLVKDYHQTPFFEEAVSTCSYLRDFVKR